MVIKIANLEPMLFLSLAIIAVKIRLVEAGTFTITNEHWPSEIRTIPIDAACEYRVDSSFRKIGDVLTLPHTSQAR